MKALLRKVESLGVDPNMPTSALYSVDLQTAETICDEVVAAFGIPRPRMDRVGSVIGTHVGPGATGFAFFDAAPDAE